ncbi:MAG: efflux RND transporter permease subunit [Clostridia bacterium]|nr:efflux RND transporter permease subunit [Clostridia bacterium]
MIKFSVKKPMTIFVIVVVIIALAIISFTRMTPDLLPSIDLPYMVVMTTYPGATPEEVEMTITRPLEQSLSTLEGIKSVSSQSSSNYSLVILEFENGYNMDAATVNTLQSIDQIKGYWPELVGSPYLMKLNPNMLPVSVAAIDRDGYTVQDLSTFYEEYVRNSLEGIDGVANISTSGQIVSYANVMISPEKVAGLNKKLKDKIRSGFNDGKSQINAAISQIDSALLAIEDGKGQLEQAHQFGMIGEEDYQAALIQIEAQEADLNDKKTMLEDQLKKVNSQMNSTLNAADITDTISVDLISSILQAQNFSMPLGYVQDEGMRYLISVGDKVTSMDQMGELYLFNFEGIGDIRLKDVADCFMSTNEDKVYGSINGNPAVLISFQKQSNYATAQVSGNIEKRFAQLEKEYEGLHFTSLMDQGEYIYLIINAILKSLMYGAIFAVIVLFLFLRDIRPTFITLLSIPISLTFAIVLMYFSNITINLISLSGLAVAVGMLVDNSIVVIENIFRFRRDGVPAKKAAIAGAKEVGGAIVSSTLTTICVFVPILFITGITKQLFTDMALTITYSLVCSLLIALTLVPAIASRIFEKDIKEEKEGAKKFKAGYKAFLNWNLNHKAVVLLVTVLLLVFSVITALSKGFIFMPSMSTPQMSGSIRMNDEESTLEETKEVANEALERIAAIEGVDKVGAMLSSSGMGAITGQRSTGTVTLYVIVDQNAKVTGDWIAEQAAEICKDLPCEVSINSASSVSSYTSALGGSGVGIYLYSNNQDLLIEGAKIVEEKLMTVEGIESVDNGLTNAEPELHLVVDKDKAMKKNLTVAQVYMAISNAMKKTSSSTSITLNGSEYDVTVGKLDDTEVLRSEIENLEIEYKTRDGKTGKVKLLDLATVTVTESLPTIHRENQRTYLSVNGAVKEGYNVTNVTAAVKEAFKDMELPGGVHYEFNGENEYIMDAMKDLLLMLLIGILLVYLIMVAQFQSLKSPFIIMFTIPLAFTGGLLALILLNKEISIIAMIGFVILVGIIVNNGIVLVDYTNQLRGRGYSKREAILESGVTRMRPVLMTSLTTILGLIIMAFGKTAGTDMMQPLALVACGGLIYATVLTLLVVPVIYDIFNGEKFNAVKEDDLSIAGLLE